MSPHPCNFGHNNIAVLYGVKPTQPDALPQTCVCGAALTYAPKVFFVSEPTAEGSMSAQEREAYALKMQPLSAVLAHDPAPAPVRRAVTALMFRDGKVCCVSRKDDPDNFGLPGGKVDDGETFAVALEREVREELGIKIYPSFITLHGMPAPDAIGLSYPAVFERLVPGEVPYHTLCCLVERWVGEPSTQPGEGRVAWLTPKEMCQERHVFHPYNRKLFDALGVRWS